MRSRFERNRTHTVYLFASSFSLHFSLSLSFPRTKRDHWIFQNAQKLGSLKAAKKLRRSTAAVAEKRRPLSVVARNSVLFSRMDFVSGKKLVYIEERQSLILC